MNTSFTTSDPQDDSPCETPSDALRDVSQEASQDVSLDVSLEFRQEASRDVLRDVSHEMSGELPQDSLGHVKGDGGGAGKRGKRRGLRGGRDPSPRFLIIMFCTWLLGAWFVSMLALDTVQPMRWMVLACAICVMAFWPVLRLSQFREAGDGDDNHSADSCRTPGRLFVDWLSLNLVFQTVVWPLHMNAQWQPVQTWWISGVIAAWSFLAGAVVALGCRSDRGGHRLVAAGICLFLLAGEPLLYGVIGWRAYGADGSPTLLISPLALLWELTAPVATWLAQPWRWQVPLVAGAGVLAWCVVLVTGRWAPVSSEALPPVVKTGRMP